MKINFLAWLLSSNRWMHLTGGVLIGGFAESLFCALYAGVGVAAALELKDVQWGGKWDWIDLTVTVVGVAVGYLIRMWVV